MSESSMEGMRESLLARMVQMVREKRIRSEEYETLRLEYRNLETSIRLGLL